MITITNSTPGDTDLIFSFYDMAVAFQKERSDRHWMSFERELVTREIAEGRQWKLLVNDTVAAIFLTADNDVEIWGEKDKGDAIYLHRIVTHPAFRGQNLFAEIAAWSKEYTLQKGRLYLRMDTWGDNERLVHYYIDNGFTLLGTVTPAETGALPAHYNCISLALLEMPVS